MQLFLLISLIVSGVLCVGGISWFIVEAIPKKPQAAVATVSPVGTSVLEENAPIPESVATSIFINEATTDVEVVDIVWKEHIGKNKSYRYAPNGLQIGKGDTVLVPTYVESKQCEVARKAIVNSEIYKVNPIVLNYKLKPVLQLVQKHHIA